MVKTAGKSINKFRHYC